MGLLDKVKATAATATEAAKDAAARDRRSSTRFRPRRRPTPCSRPRRGLLHDEGRARPPLRPTPTWRTWWRPSKRTSPSTAPSRWPRSPRGRPDSRSGRERSDRRRRCGRRCRSSGTSSSTASRGSGPGVLAASSAEGPDAVGRQGRCLAGRVMCAARRGRPQHRACTLPSFAAGWSSLVARRAHNPKVGGSNPPPATPVMSRDIGDSCVRTS